jgi:hypothetical protein
LPSPSPSPSPLPSFEEPAVPLAKPVEIIKEGCPLLLDAASNELGVAKGKLQIAIAKAMATNPDIQLCEACSKLVNSARVLQDADGSKAKALARLVNELAAPDVPPSPEQMTSIADAMAGHSGDGTYYAQAGEYLDAMVAYVQVLNKDMNAPVGDSVAFVMDKYGKNLLDNSNQNLAAYVEARLSALQ